MNTTVNASAEMTVDLRSREPLNKKGADFTGCGRDRSESVEASGHDFSRAASAAESTRALAPEGRVLWILSRIMPLSVAREARSSINQNELALWLQLQLSLMPER
jgi:hypothetical protein